MSLALRAVCLAALLFSLTPAALGQAATEAVTVAVADDSEAARAAALRRAMDAQLVRLSGDPAITGTALAARLRDAADRYLASFAYRSPGDSGDAADGMRLAVRFARAPLRDALAGARRAIWPEPPPRAVVWIALERDGARYLLDAERGAGLRAALQAAAARLGVALRWPLMDLEDRARLSYADLAGGFSEPVRAASARYAGEAVLAGRLRVAADESVQARWMLLGGRDAPVQRWQSQAQGLEAALEAAAGQLAERLREAYAYVPDRDSGRRLSLLVSGVDSLAAQRRLVDYLGALAGIERVAPLEVSGDRVRLALAVSIEPARIRAAIERDGRLQAAANGYRWR